MTKAITRDCFVDNGFIPHVMLMSEQMMFDRKSELRLCSGGRRLTIIEKISDFLLPSV